MLKWFLKYCGTTNLAGPWGPNFIGFISQVLAGPASWARYKSALTLYFYYIYII